MNAGTPDRIPDLDDEVHVKAQPGPRASALDAGPAAPASLRLGGPASLRERMPGEPRVMATQPREGGMSSRGGPTGMSPRMTAVFGGLFGLATIASVFALLIQVFPVKDQRGAIASAAVAASGSEEAPLGDEAPRSKAGPTKRVRQELPLPWRVEDLKGTHAVLKGEMKRRSLTAALDEEHVPKDQVYRILKAFDGVFKFDRPRSRDRFVVALERGSKKIVGFEYQVGPLEIYQARANADGHLEAKRLDMQPKQEEFAAAFYVGKDFVKSYEAAGLEAGLTKVLNEAFNGQTSTEAFQEGGVVKAILVETTSFGRFVGYDRVKALEYRPPDPSKPPLRAYFYEGESVRSYVDEKGRHPSNAGWRSPVPGAPVTSHFNPKRLHPVLHTVMPHNGTDFGAPSGTPVYAAFRGKVTHVGPQGPSGNLVVIEHPNGVQTGYAHLSRFADGIKAGDAVGTRQLVGYVGSTGRSTGPHLHFSAKRDGKFFDALELKLDALQLLPGPERARFAEQKAALDAALDGLAMPEPPAEATAEPADPSPEASSAAEDAAPADGEREREGEGGSAPRPAAAAEPKVPPRKPDTNDGPTLLGDDLSGEIE